MYLQNMRRSLALLKIIKIAKRDVRGLIERVCGSLVLSVVFWVHFQCYRGSLIVGVLICDWLPLLISPRRSCEYLTKFSVIDLLVQFVVQKHTCEKLREEKMWFGENRRVISDIPILIKQRNFQKPNPPL